VGVIRSRVHGERHLESDPDSDFDPEEIMTVSADEADRRRLSQDFDGPQTLAPPAAMPRRVAQIFTDLRVKKTCERGMGVSPVA